MKKILVSLLFLVAAVASFAQIDSINYPARKMPFGNWDFIWTNGALTDTVKVYPEKGGIGLDTLFFGDSKQWTAWTPGVSDTSFVHTMGDSLYGTYYWPGSDNSYIRGGALYFVNGAAFSGVEPELVYVENATNSCKMYPDKIIMEGSGYIEINDVVTKTEELSLIDDASIVLTNGISGWGEVYAFNAGTFDQWAEFIISSDGTVYLKSSSTGVDKADTDGYLCIFDNGSGVTIRNRLGGARTIKYIIHH